MTKSVTQDCELRVMAWEWIMNWKWCGSNRPFSSLRFCPCIWSGRGTLRKTSGWYPDQDLNRVFPGFKSKRSTSASALGEIGFYIYTFYTAAVFICHSRNSPNLEFCETVFKCCRSSPSYLNTEVWLLYIWSHDLSIIIIIIGGAVLSP
jgi:hypothetical protein